MNSIEKKSTQCVQHKQASIAKGVDAGGGQKCWGGTTLHFSQGLMTTMDQIQFQMFSQMHSYAQLLNSYVDFRVVCNTKWYHNY